MRCIHHYSKNKCVFSERQNAATLSCGRRTCRYGGRQFHVMGPTSDNCKSPTTTRTEALPTTGCRTEMLSGIATEETGTQYVVK